MESKENFKKKLLNNNFNLLYLLKKNNLNPYEDITAIPDSIGERTKYRNFRKDVTRILAKTICEYIDDFGAVLRNDINDCFLEEINSLQEKKYSEARSTFFVRSIISPQTEFNSLIYQEGIKKNKNGIKKFGTGNKYKLEFSNTLSYSFSTIFYKNEDDARDYLFSKFGKVKRSNKLNNVPKIKDSIITTKPNNTEESLEKKVNNLKSIEEMSEKEVLGFESDAEYKKWVKGRDEFFKENGNGWWYETENKLKRKKSNSKK